MIDPKPLWNFNDPVGSEARFRSELATASPVDAAVLQTQIARALGLQERYVDALAVLAAVDSAEPAVRVRVLLERGRVLRSSGESEQANQLFRDAVDLADRSGLDELAVDAMHMVALTLAGTDQINYTLATLTRAENSSELAARNWVPSILHNLGMAYSDNNQWTLALNTFEQALALRSQTSDAGPHRIARWTVGWTLRNLGQHQQAKVVQRALKAELDAAGLADSYVDAELALLESAHQPQPTH